MPRPPPAPMGRRPDAELSATAARTLRWAGGPSGMWGGRAPSAGEPGKPPGRFDVKAPHRNPIYWLLLATVIGWNAWLFIPRTTQPILALPYSEFTAQLDKGNVAKVRIAQASISGEFVHPVPAPARSGSKPNTQAPPVKYQRFQTTYPLAVGDSTLMPRLRAHRVLIEAVSPSFPWVDLLLSNGLPLLLMLGLLFWMGRRAAREQGGPSGVFGFGRNRGRLYQADRTKVSFADVAGADEAKQDLAEVVDFLRHPGKYLQIGAHIPRGVLLVGPPGTGKTLLARAVAGEAGAAFFSISGSEFVEMFVGVGASRVRDLFERAKAAQPSIVFVDELDAVGRRRGAGVGTVNDEREQTLNQLLVEMDGFDQRQQVILLAATNRPDVLDPALLRPGRFDRQVMVPLPDRRGREGILRIHTRRLRLAADVDLVRLSRTATGLSGADLANLCNEAALTAARHNHSEVSMPDFDEAWDKLILGAARSTVLTPHEREVVACHESGHAVVAWLTAAADPVRKVTIVPRGRALGVTEQLPIEERYNMSRGDLLARLDVMLAGREAEALVMREVTTGAEKDLIQATRLARRMIARWAMGELGPVAFDCDDEQPFLGYRMAQSRDYSETTAARIDREVEQLLSRRQTAVRTMLVAAREQLDALSARLLKEETVTDVELEAILGPRPAAAARKMQAETMMPVRPREGVVAPLRADP
jgi:cell division protease FtsH